MIRRFVVFFLVLAACFLVPKVPAIVAWDLRAVLALAARRTAGFNQFFFTFSDLGGTYGFLVFLIFPVLLFLFRKRFVTAAIYFVGVGLLKLSVSLVKVAVLRPRPMEGLASLNTYSMPSGHAANAVFMFGILAVYCWQKISHPFLRGVAVFICCLGIAFIDLSRVYLGVHFPSDVILGSLYAASGLWALQSLRRDVFQF